MKYYLAYGSNLNQQQMAQRCPNSKAIGTAVIPDYELLFKGSGVLTIEPKKGVQVPVGVWKVTERDEKNLDRYEGFPSYYHKESFTLPVTLFNGMIQDLECFVYIMRLDEPISTPNGYYYNVCVDGYNDFGFNLQILETALKKCFREGDGHEQ